MKVCATFQQRSRADAGPCAVRIGDPGSIKHLRASLPVDDHAAIDTLLLYRLAFSLPKRLLPN